ncbi:MAG: DnaJ domain-containing protein [bacterium]
MKKKIMHYKELEEARVRLGLDERATMQEIKTAYRRMARMFHPDGKKDAGGEGGDTMKEINEAYGLIIEYCKGYRYSFSREDFERNYPELNYQERFKDDWLGS